MEENKRSKNPQELLSSFMEIVSAVIKDPATFYRTMPRTGGYTDPLIFGLCMGVAAGIIQALLGIIGLGPFSSILAALSSILLAPIFMGIFSFIGAGILFVIWRVMGSREPFEVSYRCTAYSLAITPITAVLNFIPYAGPLIGIFWGTFILVCASVEVHRLEAKKAWIVFGIIALLLAASSINAQLSARRWEERLGQVEKGLSGIDKMKPEEAGQAVGEFLKGMQKGMDKK
ncbi:MAG: YIP1 family protein [Syntrophobacteraceae bacterium]